MSVTITTDYGTFTGDTIADAQKAERKGRKAAEKERARIEELKALARTRAEAQAFRIVSRQLRGEECPRGWTFFPFGVNGPHSCERIAGADYCDDTLRIETIDGRGTMEVYRNTFLGHCDNGAGFTMAIILRNSDGSESVYAVGTNEGTASAELIPGYTRENFRLTKRAEAMEPAEQVA